MIGFAVIGVGGMGRVHLSNLAAHPQARVVAVHDTNPEKLAGDFAGSGINIDAGEEAWDESRVRRCGELSAVLADEAVEAVVIATPSHLHAELTCQALAAGKHVFCEKPMALSVADCERMLAAADQADRRLQIGHVIRFWGEYVAATEVARNGRFGPLRGLWLSRLCGPPDWSGDNWFLDHTKSGGALLDLHIHDVDYALHLLGKPRAIRARGQVGPSGGYDRIFAWYDYGNDGPAVQAEGVWTMGSGAPFVMSFRMYLEEGTIELVSNRRPTLLAYGPDGPVELDVPARTGFAAEMDHFIQCIDTGSASEIVPPASSRDSVAVALSTAESIRTGRQVEIP